MRCVALLLATNAAITLTAAAQSNRLKPPLEQSSNIVEHLERTIAWYRGVSAVEGRLAGTADPASRDRLHQAAVKALQLAFEFARAEAVLLKNRSEQAPAAQPPESGTATNLEQVSARLADRATTLQSQVNDVDARLRSASGRNRKSLVDEHDALIADLDVTRELQNSIATIRQFATNAFSTRATDALTAQIDDLARSVPEVSPSASAGGPRTTRSPDANLESGASSSGTASGATVSASASALRPESAGLIALLTELLTIETARRELDDILGETLTMSESIEQRRAPLTNEARDLVREGDVSTASPADRAQLAGKRRDLQAAVARVKQLSTAFVPLGEQAIAVDTARNVLVGWRNGLAGRARSAGRYLLVRAILLVVIIGVLLVLSEFWRRATLRYLRDARRRSQLLLVRRIVIGFAIGIVLVIGFASELGSVATYAGFVTAGLAVALQNVILAIVAYFFLIGRYGVRVGDRVTVAGVTGNVVEIGLVRIYLMELTAPDWRPTGRIVVFSNAVLFQPSALFKQMPGVDYIWRTLTLTLAPETDVQHAEHQLGESIGAVFEQYRAAIDQQHATLQRTLDVQTPVPRPEVRARYTTEGVEFSIRYPVERLQAGDIDRRVIAAIRDTIAGDSALKLLATGAPRVDSETG